MRKRAIGAIYALAQNHERFAWRGQILRNAKSALLRMTRPVESNWQVGTGN
jgi:hypothetical protein